jgi:hypothetical protein
MWLWKVSKWPWFWAEVAVKAWWDLATLKFCRIWDAIIPGPQH